ncbi:MAG TPA: membrane protein insertion efficiency factor YidD [Candidatus Magasanikbacteria bacterium]|nr:membrane protein insertion efficiency factor YidD [Candidatus Magasanikbacteria bacterium]
MKFLFLKLIRFYQRTISPDHGWFRGRFPYGYCKFYPSCSQYAHEAIEKKGVVRGVFLAVWRVLRCNPWGKGGVDRL